MIELAYQDEPPTEMLSGKITLMSPRPAINHNIVMLNIAGIFRRYLKGKPCVAFSDGVDVFLTQNDRVIPDVMIVCNRDIIKTNGVYGAPDLVVEILSPSTAKKDRGYKKNLYEKCGVKEYWLVDTEHCSVEVYLLVDNKLELNDIYTVFPDYLLEKMTPEEKQNIICEFKTSLFTDMTITLEEVFEGRF